MGGGTRSQSTEPKRLAPLHAEDDALSQYAAGTGYMSSIAMTTTTTSMRADCVAPYSSTPHGIPSAAGTLSTSASVPSLVGLPAVVVQPSSRVSPALVKAGRHLSPP